jgi:FdhE protein
MSPPAESKLFLDLYRQIAEAKSAFRSRHRDDVIISDKEIQRRVESNESFLDLQKLQIEEKLLDEFFNDLLPILRNNEFFKREEIERFLNCKDKIDFRVLTRPVLTRDLKGFKALSEQFNVKVDFLMFVGFNLIQAVLELYADRLKSRVNQESWLRGNCPVCGGDPAIEKLRRDDGKRIMQCSLCGTEWQFKRITCPFCANDDHNSLRYFFVEEDSSEKEGAFRVDVCDKCKTYIKTIDERKLPESKKVDLFLENTNTIYLDILAQRDGYVSPTYWMIGPSEDIFV